MILRTSFWVFQKSYSFNGNDDAQPTSLTVCLVPHASWYQTWPEYDACYDVTINPAAMGFAGDLDFGALGIGIPRR